MITDAASLGPICAFLSSITWAIGTSTYSRLAAGTSPFTINFTRAAFAFPMFLLAAILLAGGPGPATQAFAAVRAEHWGWFTLSMVASYGLGDSLFMWSAQSLGVPGALAIASCYPLWTALAGYLFLGESITPLQIVGLAITLAGVITVILSEPARGQGLSGAGRAPAAGSRARGVVLAALTSLFWTCNSFALSHGGRGLPTAIGNSVRMLIALGLTFALGRLLAPKAPVLLPLRDLKRSGWVFALEGFGGSYFFLYGLAHSTLAIGSTLTSLAPILSVPVAVALRLEKFSPKRTLGIVAVVLGLYFLVLKTQ